MQADRQLVVRGDRQLVVREDMPIVVPGDRQVVHIEVLVVHTGYRAADCLDMDSGTGDSWAAAAAAHTDYMAAAADCMYRECRDMVDRRRADSSDTLDYCIYVYAFGRDCGHCYHCYHCHCCCRYPLGHFRHASKPAAGCQPASSIYSLFGKQIQITMPSNRTRLSV